MSDRCFVFTSQINVAEPVNVTLFYYTNYILHVFDVMLLQTHVVHIKRTLILSRLPRIKREHGNKGASCYTITIEGKKLSTFQQVQ